MNDFEITSNLWRGVYDKVETAVGSEVRIKVWAEVEYKVRAEVWAEVDEVGYRVQAEVKKIEL